MQSSPMTVSAIKRKLDNYHLQASTHSNAYF